MKQYIDKYNLDKMDKRNLLNFILALAVIIFAGLFIRSQGYLGGEGETNEIGERALEYVNQQILPEMEEEPVAELGSVTESPDSEHTHKIEINHPDLQVEGYRKGPDEFEFSIQEGGGDIDIDGSDSSEGFEQEPPEDPGEVDWGIFLQNEQEAREIIESPGECGNAIFTFYDEGCGFARRHSVALESAQENFDVDIYAFPTSSDFARSFEDVVSPTTVFFCGEMVRGAMPTEEVEHRIRNYKNND